MGHEGKGSGRVRGRDRGMFWHGGVYRPKARGPPEKVRGLVITCPALLSILCSNGQGEVAGTYSTLVTREVLRVPCCPRATNVCSTTTTTTCCGGRGASCGHRGGEGRGYGQGEGGQLGSGRGVAEEQAGGASTATTAAARATGHGLFARHIPHAAPAPGDTHKQGQVHGARGCYMSDT